MLNEGGGILLVWVLVALVAFVWTIRLVFLVWKQRKTSGVAAKLLAAAVGVAALVGGGGTLVGLVKAFGAVGGESVDPSQKARMLAEGISEAMNCTALGLLTWLPAVVALLVVMAKARRAANPTRSAH